MDDYVWVGFRVKCTVSQEVRDQEIVNWGGAVTFGLANKPQERNFTFVICPGEKDGLFIAIDEGNQPFYGISFTDLDEVQSRVENARLAKVWLKNMIAMHIGICLDLFDKKMEGIEDFEGRAEYIHEDNPRLNCKQYFATELKALFP